MISVRLLRDLGPSAKSARRRSRAANYFEMGSKLEMFPYLFNHHYKWIPTTLNYSPLLLPVSKGDSSVKVGTFSHGKQLVYDIRSTAAKLLAIKGVDLGLTELYDRVAKFESKVGSRRTTKI